jgi:hypothetical protein
MANEYALPHGEPDPDIRHIKRFAIFVESDGGTPVSQLRFRISGFTAEDEDDSGGTVIDASKSVSDYIDEFLASDELVRPLERTPLDFALQNKCHVVLKLMGDFWEFSRVRGPITMKEEHSDKRYYNPRAIEVDGQVRAVLFSTAQPLPAATGTMKNVRHGFNLHIDFVDGDLRLPVLIDPDIENRGGNN